MKIKEITNYIEELAPLHYAEDFDNVGLLVGDYQTEITGVLVTLDTLGRHCRRGDCQKLQPDC